MAKVDIFSWNPSRKIHIGLLGVFLRRRSLVNNFGDLLGPYIIERILSKESIVNAGELSGKRLISVGSVLHFARPGDVIWGSGINGKIFDFNYKLDGLDIRSVRGPLTRDVLLRAGHAVPPIYGDPGLLVANLFRDDLIAEGLPSYDLTVVPNLNDFSTFRKDETVMDPRSDMVSCIQRIACSKFVIGSSLHAIIIADAFGVPARLIASNHEPGFKYEDYYLGSGRSGYLAARSVSHAIDLGGECMSHYSPDSLFGAFPFDLWRK